MVGIELASESAGWDLLEDFDQFPGRIRIESGLLWPRDPAQSLNLLCVLEARLADGHRNTKQTKTLHHGLTPLLITASTARLSSAVLGSCLCSSLVGDSAVSLRPLAAWRFTYPLRVAPKHVYCVDCALLDTTPI